MNAADKKKHEAHMVREARKAAKETGQPVCLLNTHNEITGEPEIGYCLVSAKHLLAPLDEVRETITPDGKRWSAEYGRLTDCCGALSTYCGDDLSCKRCYRSVPVGQGDGNEQRDGLLAEPVAYKINLSTGEARKVRL